MTLSDRIEKTLKATQEGNLAEKEALREAERLADEYADIVPKNDFVSPEKYMGLPVFTK